MTHFHMTFKVIFTKDCFIIFVLDQLSLDERKITDPNFICQMKIKEMKRQKYIPIGNVIKI